ncbi:Transmembrane protein 131 [Hondaea fermentalgiana]|uniref:Transmembrane protein 131 n=1 Tax=Hondaea fermentalgiana TaxID=2315210 RepID=A0A2R5GLP5_9STRA|nr:Transmembrane protein 131 [Hondaea fermentalgiana]|eukprot:GBG31555.1 Transmembrane protein 131 [Hondaea fermentalgiana]
MRARAAGWVAGVLAAALLGSGGGCGRSVCAAGLDEADAAQRWAEPGLAKGQPQHLPLHPDPSTSDAFVENVGGAVHEDEGAQGDDTRHGDASMQAFQTNALSLSAGNLDFGEVELGEPAVQTLLLRYEAARGERGARPHRAVELVGWEATDPQVQVPMFSRRILRAGEQVQVLVSLSPWRLGVLESALFLTTSEGRFLVRVRANAVASRFRLQPLVGARIGTHVVWRPALEIYNPDPNTALEITQVFTTEGYLHLRIDEGANWTVPPLQTRQLARISFQSPQNSFPASWNPGLGTLMPIETRPAMYLIRYPDPKEPQPLQTWNAFAEPIVILGVHIVDALEMLQDKDLFESYRQHDEDRVDGSGFHKDPFSSPCHGPLAADRVDSQFAWFRFKDEWDPSRLVGTVVAAGEPLPEIPLLAARVNDLSRDDVHCRSRADKTRAVVIETNVTRLQVPVHLYHGRVRASAVRLPDMSVLTPGSWDRIDIRLGSCALDSRTQGASFPETLKPYAVDHVDLDILLHREFLAPGTMHVAETWILRTSQGFAMSIVIEADIVPGDLLLSLPAPIEVTEVVLGDEARFGPVEIESTFNVSVAVEWDQMNDPPVHARDGSLSATVRLETNLTGPISIPLTGQGIIAPLHMSLVRKANESALSAVPRVTNPLSDALDAESCETLHVAMQACDESPCTQDFTVGQVSKNSIGLHTVQQAILWSSGKEEISLASVRVQSRTPTLLARARNEGVFPRRLKPGNSITFDLELTMDCSVAHAGGVVEVAVNNEQMHTFGVALAINKDLLAECRATQHRLYWEGTSRWMQSSLENTWFTKEEVSGDEHIAPKNSKDHLSTPDSRSSRKSTGGDTGGGGDSDRGRGNAWNKASSSPSALHGSSGGAEDASWRLMPRRHVDPSVQSIVV